METETMAYRIGDRVIAESDDGSYTVEGRITAGYSIETDELTRVEGVEISIDAVVTVAETHGFERLNGWLWSFEKIEAVAA
jgi:hypothetical protein